MCSTLPYAIVSLYKAGQPNLRIYCIYYLKAYGMIRQLQQRLWSLLVGVLGALALISLTEAATVQGTTFYGKSYLTYRATQQ
ncbi:MAG: hypothetical protein GFH27_549291n314 [Chloroflexi bacterium AL-W]|nr:hypothetical protein [Chloroflexi bacterium AL-N1]NOK67218.1 hypothetical protein [Chloroflexi bacterium AL-N10]NOK75288.1 hypothetical protein [Chloroflexi bacterium AL-N5]NOK82076.1 hypothetical protein [Chloroflexi bacterium AL-W]NOK89921.1 hypothetical protein [Chloroflexi bacterium AL-N15]